ncbi:MerR family transcriptional regulator [Brachybacterium halotolerans subsp. kimchii]|uniref:MerR family transcriptional regulator n=1 Tax=Brachybacterium halotolerans TaxID=2795215 RepID=UPI001E58B55E|nr:MerR family transcriptional regulator [Brachybacterium halotolerans]UEJ81583.1 MerR family transcriptional regulator [Brachybacterium halotolerans subsp. kimchii]
MPSEKLLTISTFARAVGVPASALRHYAALHVLEPADVDTVSGYRYYAPSQIEDGLVVAQMRAAHVPIQTMRTILHGSASGAAAALEDLLAEHSDHARDRRVELGRLRRRFLSGPADQKPTSAALSGPQLSRALHDVLAATMYAEGNVAGVTLEIAAGGVELAATDRYWLVRRVLRTDAEGGPTRVTLAPTQAREIADLTASEPRVEVDLDRDAIVIRPAGSSSDATSYPAVDRAVPHLGLLVTTQPDPVVLMSVDRLSLLDALQSHAPNEPLRICAIDEQARVGDEILQGWSRGPAAHAESGGATIHIQPALLARAITLVDGADVLLSWSGADAPMFVEPDAHDTLTCLVMPMRV